MTPQIDDGPRMPFGRYGREPSREPGKLSSPVPMRSERIAGSAGTALAPDPQPGGSKDTRADQSERSRAPEFSGRVRRSSEQASHRSLPRKRESSFAALLLLSESQTLRWFAIRSENDEGTSFPTRHLY